MEKLHARKQMSKQLNLTCPNFYKIILNIVIVINNNSRVHM